VVPRNHGNDGANFVARGLYRADCRRVDSEVILGTPGADDALVGERGCGAGGRSSDPYGVGTVRAGTFWKLFSLCTHGVLVHHAVVGHDPNEFALFTFMLGCNCGAAIAYGKNPPW
jgi:hypothetical protein